MPFTLECFASKIAGLRASRGSTPQQVAAATGISPDRLSALESAQIGPTGDEILIISDHFNCEFGWLIEDDAINSDENLRILFRSAAEKLSTEDRYAVAEFLYLCKSQAFTDELLNTHAQKAGFKFIPKGRYHLGDGQDCAKALRTWHGIPPTGFIQDIYEWFRSIGIRVFRRCLPNSVISGLFIDHPYAGRCILINSSEDLYRQRFSAAHEGGHALMDTDQAFNISEENDQRSNDPRELRANAFASDFLIPPELLRDLGTSEQWKNPTKITETADRLWVSVPALLSALKRAKIIDEETRTTLKAMQLRLPIKRDPELSGDLSPLQRERKCQLLARGLHNTYVHQCFEAYAHNFVTRGKLAEMLLVKADDVPEIAVLFGRTLHHD